MTDSEYIAILEATNVEHREQIKNLEEKVALLLELLQKQNINNTPDSFFMPAINNYGPSGFRQLFKSNFGGP